MLETELERALPAFEPRPSQLAMAEQVERALSQGRALLVEAGTGTGKTLAYLLPAARSGLKVVISTATKTLQEQLADKDVPLVQALGVEARFAFLKGRQNYLCLLRKEHFDRQPTFAARDEAGMYGQLHAWAQETRTGDRAELSGLPDGFATWREVNSTADTCTGQKCPHYDRCFVFAMRRQAAEADVVIVNHHLFFADLALRSSSAGDAGAAVLPRYDAVVFDEAHAVEEVATEHFGAQLSSFRVGELGRDALKSLAAHSSRVEAAGLAARLMREGREFFDVALESSQEGRWPLLRGALQPAEAERTRLAELVRALGAAVSGSGAEDLARTEPRCLALAALYLPRDMPDPQDSAFPEAVAGELRELLPITSGRAFVLFTSLRNMRAVHALLAAELPWQVLLQGEAPKAQLLKRFRDRPSVLFASQSFWEGVDVPGEALSLVVIDKLPFASPGEPIVAARIERLRAEGQDAFYGYQLPQAALALKQGFGRLIRSSSDRGIVAVLDARMSRKGYGRVFIESLPRCRILRSPAEAADFWTGEPCKGATGA